MHPLRHPRNALAVGALFVVIAVIYYAVPVATGDHVDVAGTVMLGVLGIAMSLMAYILIAGSPND